MEQGAPREEPKRILGQVLTKWASDGLGGRVCGDTGDKSKIIQLLQF